jgi:hypothetical protein
MGACDRQRVLVLDTGRLCRVDHFFRVVLLVADATCRKECVDAGDTGQVDTWVAGEDVATTRELGGGVHLLSAFAFKWCGRMGWYARRLGDPAISARQREGRSVRDEGGGIESCGGDGDGGVLYATQL